MLVIIICCNKKNPPFNNVLRQNVLYSCFWGHPVKNQYATKKYIEVKIHRQEEFLPFSLDKYVQKNHLGASI